MLGPTCDKPRGVTNVRWSASWSMQRSKRFKMSIPFHRVFWNHAGCFFFFLRFATISCDCLILSEQVMEVEAKR